MIQIKDLRVEFQTERGILQAVRGVSLDIESGVITGVVGESGSGKSVLFHSVMRLIPGKNIKSGSVHMDTIDLFNLDKSGMRELRGNKCGMIFQEPGRSFDPLYTIGKNFHETIKAHDKKCTKEDSLKKATALLEEVGIKNSQERLNNYPHQLSGGQLQRVMAALSVSSNPEYLIADEPTTALDVTIQKKIIELLLKMKNDRKLGVVFITHDLSLLKGFADRVVVMYAGILLEDGPVRDVFDNPQHPYTKALITSIPVPGTHYTKEKLTSIRGSVPSPINPPPGCPYSPRCPYATDKCNERIPDFIQYSEKHKYRCILKNGGQNA